MSDNSYPADALLSSWEYMLPLLLRGLTFDGRKGLFIHTASGGTSSVPREGDLVLRADGCGPQSERKRNEFLSSLQESFRQYCLKEGRFPPAAALTLECGTEVRTLRCALGSSYEEAVSGSGCSALPGERAGGSRAEAVTGKTVLVTGAAQGFGEGMVRDFVRSGAFVFAADRNAAGTRALAEEINSSCGRTAVCPLGGDVTDEGEVEALTAAVIRETGGLDLLVSNAGVLKAGSVKQMSLADFRFVTEVDYTGFFICTKYFSRIMALQNSVAEGYLTDIITVSSKSGLVGSNRNGAYSGAKFGTIGLTQSFALELIGDGVKVNAVCPGNFLDGPLWSDPQKGLFVQYLNTGKVPGARSIADVRAFYEAKVPMGRGCTVEDVMRAILYIVEQQYETGQAVPVTGGQVMLS
jgi:sorbitol-6-phosphate 2-dehydrogenase